MQPKKKGGGGVARNAEKENKLNKYHKILKELFIVFEYSKQFFLSIYWKYFSVKVWDLENMHSTNTYRGKKCNTFLI